MLLGVTARRKLRPSVGRGSHVGTGTPLKYRVYEQGSDPPAAVICGFENLGHLLGRFYSFVLWGGGSVLNRQPAIAQAHPSGCFPRAFPCARAQHCATCTFRPGCYVGLALGWRELSEPGESAASSCFAISGSLRKKLERAGGPQGSSTKWLKTLVGFLICPLTHRKPCSPCISSFWEIYNISHHFLTLSLELQMLYFQVYSDIFSVP